VTAKTRPCPRFPRLRENGSPSWHRRSPRTDEGAWILLIEPYGTPNTGDPATDAGEVAL